ncbi:asparagine synthase-related protein [Novosphingobium sp. RD2P27]|uniref:asparagine synthase (glutamine-hydrolyzing) n=1 Tax=Novosphingobium kalidii TaxID=3230299 RepID=A0ABV2D2S4_9SPHN
MAGIYGRSWQTNLAASNSDLQAVAASLMHRAGVDHQFTSGDGWLSGAVGPKASIRQYKLARGAHLTVIGTFLFEHSQHRESLSAFEQLAMLLDGDAEGIASWFQEADGCFALAMVDPERRKLLLANDRYGGVPIYTRQQQSTLSWASEVKALAQQDLAAIDRTAVDDFLTRGWLAPPRTYYHGISQLPSGTALLANLTTGETKNITVFSHRRAERTSAIPFDDAKAELKSRVRQAIQNRIAQSRSDEVVVTLSGGLDSRLLAAEAAAHANVRTVTYGQPRSPELKIAGDVARTLSLPHEIIPIDQSNWMAGRDRAVWMTDGMMNFADTHIVHVADAITDAGLVLDGLFGDVVLGRGEITVDPGADVFENRYLRMNRFTYFGPRIEQNFATVATPLIDRELVNFMDSLPPEFTRNGRLYREASGEMHREVYSRIPWLKSGALPYPYRPQRLSTALAKVDRRASQMSGWVGIPFFGERFTMDYFRWFRTKSFQALYRALVDGEGAMLRDFASVPATGTLFGRIPSMKRLQMIGRVLTMEVWLRQAAAGRALSWEEMLGSSGVRR